MWAFEVFIESKSFKNCNFQIHLNLNKIGYLPSILQIKSMPKFTFSCSKVRRIIKIKKLTFSKQVNIISLDIDKVNTHSTYFPIEFSVLQFSKKNIKKENTQHFSRFFTLFRCRIFKTKHNEVVFYGVKKFVGKSHLIKNEKDGKRFFEKNTHFYRWLSNYITEYWVHKQKNTYGIS